MPTLTDALTRHQIYFEGLKSWKSFDYNQTLDVLRQRVGTLVLDATDGGVGDMPARDYRALERRISAQLDRTLTRSREVFMQDLRGISDANNAVLRSIYGDRTTRRRLPTNAQLWTSANRKLMGATGTTLDAFVRNYFTSAKASILAELRKARTDNKTARELYGILRGTKNVNYKNGVLNKIKNQANTVIATALQHLSSVSQGRYGAIFTERYKWVSVIDAVTTDICRARNGKVYLYGKGPLPPAHYGCRSTIVPVDTDDKGNTPDNYFDWLQQQPREVLQDILGAAKANEIINGTAKRVDYPKFTEVQRIPIERFADKLKFILAD